MKKIVFTGGGTAGHIMPNLALIEKLKDCKIYYIGSSGMEKEIVGKQKDIIFKEINVVKLQKKLSVNLLKFPFKLLSSIKECKQILKEIKPDLIFSKGGYVSVPVCLAGSKLNIPILTHESDLTVGLANRLIARKADSLLCSFEVTAKKYGKNAIFTGSPIREKIFKGNADIVKNKLHTSPLKPTILIVGGSQGAMSINKVIWQNAKKLSDKYNIIHIVGKNNVNQKIKAKDYFQIEFADDIENFFALSDVVISRSGSNTIFELLALSKPMILIPLPKSSASRGDQVLNAKNFKANNFANVIFQENLTIDTLLQTITDTLVRRNFFKTKMTNASKNAGNRKILEIINAKLSN